jgi:hypothetical protein
MLNSFGPFIRSNYYTGISIEANVEYEETIAFVKERLFEGDADSTSILVFESGKELSLNQTILRTLVGRYGLNPANVIGKTIILYRELVPFGTKTVPGVRIRCDVPDPRKTITGEPNKAIGATPIKPDSGSGAARWERYGDPPPPAREPPSEADVRGDDPEDPANSIPF